MDWDHTGTISLHAPCNRLAFRASGNFRVQGFRVRGFRTLHLRVFLVLEVSCLALLAKAGRIDADTSSCPAVGLEQLNRD